MSPKKETYILFTLAAVNFTHVVDFMIMMPLGPQLMRIFSITPQDHSSLVSSYTFAAGVAGFLGAFAIDRFDRKRALQLVYLFFCLGTLACAFAPSYSWLLLARAATGCFGGLQSGLVFSIIGDLVPLSRRGTAMGIVMTSFSIGSIIGVPFGLYLANKFNWHIPFVFLFLVGVIVFIAICSVLPQMRDHVAQQKKEIDPLQVLKNVAQDRNQVIALSFTLALMLGQFLIIPLLSPYMVSNVGFKESDLPWIYFLGGGLTIFSAPIVGRLSDKYGKQKIFTIFSLLIPVPILWITNMGVNPLWVGLLATCLFFVVTNGRFVPATTMTTAVVPPQNRGTFMSINSSVQQLGAAAGAAISGLIISTGSSGQIVDFEWAGAGSVALALTALYLGRKIQLKE